MGNGTPSRRAMRVSIGLRTTKYSIVESKHLARTAEILLGITTLRWKGQCGVSGTQSVGYWASSQ